MEYEHKTFKGYITYITKTVESDGNLYKFGMYAIDENKKELFLHITITQDQHGYLDHHARPEIELGNMVRVNTSRAIAEYNKYPNKVSEIIGCLHDIHINMLSATEYIKHKYLIENYINKYMPWGIFRKKRKVK